MLFLYAFFGLLVGIVINRASDNLPPPARRSLVAAPQCAYCGTPRATLEQFGIVSFLVGRAHCHNCHAPLPLRAPLVEIATALLFAFLWDRFGASVNLVVLSFFTAILLLILVIDVEHRLILNVVILPATLLALIASPLTMLNQVTLASTPFHLLLIRSALGAAIGYIVVYGIYFFGGLFAKLMSRARGKALNEVAFGLGDVKLAGLVGALVGFPAIFFVLVYAILLGGVGALAAIAFQLAVRRRYSAFMAIPYGPFFVIAGWVLMIWGRDIVRGFLG
jgi:leader peptidase (prepilin peptidase)/N-methyltransferase